MGASAHEDRRARRPATRSPSCGSTISRPASASRTPRSRPRALRRTPAAPQPVQVFALSVKDRKDEVRLAAALAKLVDEDPSLVFIQDQETGELQPRRPGRDASALRARAPQPRVSAWRRKLTKPLVAYRETIKRRRLRARPPQEAIGRPWPVRRRRHRREAAAGAATASPSTRRCMAARCRANISPRSRPA